jgi:hypothetical protein
MISKNLYVQGEDSADGKTPDIGRIYIYSKFTVKPHIQGDILMCNFFIFIYKTKYVKELSDF